MSIHLHTNTGSCSGFLPMNQLLHNVHHFFYFLERKSAPSADETALIAIQQTRHERHHNSKCLCSRRVSNCRKKCLTAKSPDQINNNNRCASSKSDRFIWSIKDRTSTITPTESDSSDRSTSTDGPPLPKNTDQNVYCTNPLYKDRCVVCQKGITHLAPHYVNDHPNAEVYTSRLSPEMVELCCNGIEPAIPMRSKQYKSNCVFCHKSCNMRVDNWMRHVATHTGEYSLECGYCKHKFGKSNEHQCKQRGGKVPMEREIDVEIEFDGKALFAFLCKLCNFTQMDASNVERHIAEQHELTDLTDEDFERYIKKIAIMAIGEVPLKVSVAPVPQIVATARQKQFVIPTPPPVIKNNDKRFYFANPKYRNQCVLCPEKTSFIVNHYVQNHPTTEVFVSRISDKMMTMCSSGDAPIVADKPAICVFCDRPNTFLKNQWIEHMTAHSGEWMWKCNKCGCVMPFKSSHATSKTCASLCSDIVRTYDLDVDEEDNCLYAYACTFCNYVQFKMENIRVHIRENHEIDEEDIESSAIKIALLKLASNNKATTRGSDGRKRPIKEEPSTADDFSQPSKSLAREVEFSVAVDKEGEPRNPLKPWTHSLSLKSQQIALRMLHDTTLLSLFKCMSNECKFSTDIKDDMQYHLCEHELSTLLGDDDDEENKPQSYLECAYCATLASGPPELVEHVTQIHSNSVFQCQHCFYRSVDAYSVEVHLKYYHPDMKPAILICKGYEEKTPEGLALELEFEQDISTLRPLEWAGKQLRQTNFLNQMRTIHGMTI